MNKQTRGLLQGARSDGKDGKGNTVTVPRNHCCNGAAPGHVQGKASQVRGVQRPSCRKPGARINRSLAVDKMGASQVEGAYKTCLREQAGWVGQVGIMAEMGEREGEAISRKAL